MVRPWRESIAEEAETIALWIEELEHISSSEVDQHEDELIDSMILDSYLSRKEPNGGRIRDHVKSSEKERLMKDIIKTAVEVVSKCIVKKIVEETIEDVITVGYDEQKEGIEAVLRNMVEQCCSDTIWWATWTSWPTSLVI